MGKVLFIMSLPFIAWWAIGTWWKIRTARSGRERTLLSRGSMAAAIGLGLGFLAIFVIPGQGKAIVLPIVIVASLIYSRSVRAALAKIREEERDQTRP